MKTISGAKRLGAVAVLGTAALTGIGSQAKANMYDITAKTGDVSATFRIDDSTLNISPELSAFSGPIAILNGTGHGDVTGSLDPDVSGSDISLSSQDGVVQLGINSNVAYNYQNPAATLESYIQGNFQSSTLWISNNPYTDPTVTITPAPEPTSAGMLGLGAVALAVSGKGILRKRSLDVV